MKISEVLRAAAELVNDKGQVEAPYYGCLSEYSCNAIHLVDVTFDEQVNAKRFYTRLMGNQFGYLLVNDFGSEFTRKQQNHRKLALLLAAEVAEGEGQ